MYTRQDGINLKIFQEKVGLSKKKKKKKKKVSAKRFIFFLDLVNEFKFEVLGR